MKEIDGYVVATDEQKQELGYCEDYDLLLGPNGFECMLGEPEDCTWYRDGSGAVDELNRLLKIVNENG